MKWWIFETQQVGNGWLFIAHMFGGDFIIAWSGKEKKLSPIQEDAHVERSILDV